MDNLKLAKEIGLLAKPTPDMSKFSIEELKELQRMMEKASVQKRSDEPLVIRQLIGNYFLPAGWRTTGWARTIAAWPV